VLSAAALLAAAPAPAADDPLGLRWYETPELRLVVPAPQLEAFVPHAARSFGPALRWNRVRFGWTPTERPVVMLKDFSDQSLANATTTPLNTLRVEVSPGTNPLDTNPANERMATLMNHEMVHLANGDVANTQDRFWRRAFGGKVAVQADNPETLLYAYLSVPRFTVPRWLLEGSAVFMETWMGGGLGRAQGGFDEMVFRAMVRDGTPFHDPLSLATRGVRSDFQASANAYLYGTRFFTWLAWQHGPDPVLAWLRRDEGSPRHYAAAFEAAFGLPLGRAWAQWVAFEQDFQRANLASVNAVPATPLVPVTPRALGSSSRLFTSADGTRLYGAFRQTGVVEHLGEIDRASGQVRRLVDIEGGTLYTVASVAFDPQARRLFFTARNHHRRDLMVHELDSGRTRTLLKEARIGELAFNPADGALIGVRHSRGFATLVRIAPPYERWEPLHTFAYGVVPSELDISADGQLLAASVSEPQGEQFLRVWSLPELVQPPGRLVLRAQAGFGQAAPEGFVFEPGGRTMVGSSYYTGVSNLFRVELDSGRQVALSNAETGLFRPLPLADGTVLALAYTGEGLQPVQVAAAPQQRLGAIRFLGSELVARHPALKDWAVVPTAEDAEVAPVDRGVYRPLERLGRHSAYPVLQGYKESVGLGWRWNFGDWLRYADASLTVAVTPDQRLPAHERLHAEAKGQYLGWRGSLAWNRSDFYDLFGPTQRSRKGLRVALGYDLPLIHELPRRLDLKLDLARATGIDTLPGAQNVASGGSALTTAELALSYRHVRRSLGAVDDEKGVVAELQLTNFAAQGRTTPQLQGRLELGWALPWPHAALWWRSAAGASGGDAADPQARFYFGAFGNNRIDNGPVPRYRETAAMPGFEIDALSGRRFVRQQLELVLPRTLFDAAGTPDLHATWLRPALFVGGLWTDPDRPGARRHASAGAQLDLRLGVLHWYEMVLSLGHAQGWTDGRRAGREWMVSLKIL